MFGVYGTHKTKGRRAVGYSTRKAANKYAAKLRAGGFKNVKVRVPGGSKSK